VPVSIDGLRLRGDGQRHLLADDDPMAHNDPTTPDRLRVVEQAVTGFGDTVDLPPCSVTLWVLAVGGA